MHRHLFGIADAEQHTTLIETQTALRACVIGRPTPQRIMTACKLLEDGFRRSGTTISITRVPRFGTIDTSTIFMRTFYLLRNAIRNSGRMKPGQRNDRPVERSTMPFVSPNIDR